MFKKISAVLAALVTVITLLAITTGAQAKDAYNSFQMRSNTKSVYLGRDQTHAESDRVIGNQKLFSAVNSANSAHGVNVIPKYSTGGIWHSDDRARTIAQNSILYTTYTTTQSGAMWYLQLDPSGPWTKECNAKGYIGYVNF